METPPPVEPRPFAWATWRRALLLLAAFTVFRLVHGLWLSPWELVGDEAYYWVQSQHLELGYTEKGPLLAWLIAASCALFGHVEWAVRLPVLLSGVVAAWGVGRLAMAASRGDERVGFVALLLFLLLPAFLANSMICTQDGPLIALWVALTAVCMRLFRRWEAGRSVWGEWMLFWALIGVGILLKHSVLTFLPGMAIYWLLRRGWRTMPIRAVTIAQQGAGVVVLAAVVTPMIVWNARNDWPMLAHTLGHLGAGGDQAGKVNAGNPLLWELNTIGSFVGIFGPALVLMIWSCVWAWRRRASDPALWNDRLWLMCAAWFTTLFIIALSLIKPIVPSWPLPNMPPMVVLVAQLIVIEWGTTPTTAWSTRRRLRAWTWGTAAFGLIATAGLHFPMVLWNSPIYRNTLREKVLGRIAGHRERLGPVARVLATVQTPDKRPPLLVMTNYQRASLATFYLPGHPPVTTSGNIVSVRPSNFDRWPETDLRHPLQHGRTLILVNGLADPKWDEYLIADRMEPAGEPELLIATNYQGVRPLSPPAPVSAGADAP